MNASGNMKKPVSASDLLGEKPARIEKKRTGNLKEDRDAIRKRFGG
jgi:hypothetical protein